MKKNSIKVSIVVPCYKVEEYLPRCLDSLVNQTFKDIEIICVNDGSPDNSLNILKNYKKKYKDKIVIIDKENEGVWKARIDGVKIAKGDYIGFIDSDDYVALDFIEKIYKNAIKKKADISVCGFDRIDLDTGKRYSREMCKPENKVINVKKNPGELIEINGAPWNKIYKKELFLDMYEMKTIPKILEDLMFQQLLYLKAKKVVFIPNSLIYYMVRKDSTINSIKKDMIEDTYNAMKEVRNVYEKENTKMLDYIDATAFLHLGVSLMYRLSESNKSEFNKIFKNNKEFLNNNFPNWIKTEYTTLKYIINNNGSNLKLWILKIVYKLNLFNLFITLYNFMINKLKIDIKW